MDELPFQAEYAKSGRAGCKGCKEKIPQGAVRLAAMVQSAFHDGKQANWYHMDCFFEKQRPKSIDEIGKINSLRNADRKKVVEALEGVSGIALPEKGKKGKGAKKRTQPNQALKDFLIQYSVSSRATCRHCEIVIVKGEIRVSKKVFDTDVGMKFGGQDTWYHLKCFNDARQELLYLAGGEDLPGFTDLSAEDKKLVKAEIKPLIGDEVPIKKLKMEPKDDNEIKQDKKIETQIEKQNKLYFKYYDMLSTRTKLEMENILELNNQEVPTGKDECRTRLADMMAFGALEPCPECKQGQLVLENNGYKCTGNITEWAKCLYMTQAPARKKMCLPTELKKDPAFKGCTSKVKTRLFRTPLSPLLVLINTDQNGTQEIKKEKPKPPPMKNLQFIICVKSAKKKEEIKVRILKLGGLVVNKIQDTTAAAVGSKKDIEAMLSKMQEVQERGIEVVEESFFDLIDKENGTVANTIQLIKENNIADWGTDPATRIPQDVLDGKSIPKSGSMYAKSKSGTTKLKLKGGTAVDPDSGLEDVAHVYKDEDGTKYTTVLGKTDIVANKNSYYKIQVLEADHKKKLARERSASGSLDRSQSEAPSRHHGSLRLALVMEGPEIEPQNEPPYMEPALLVSPTPGDSIIKVEEPEVNMTPAWSVQRVRDPSPLCSNMLERVEAMDISDEEVEELAQTEPWHLRRWVDELGRGRESPVSEPLPPNTCRIEEGADAGVRPSTSGLAGGTLEPVAKWEDQGSDLDVDYDDEFDICDIETNGLAGAEQNIPDDEELDQAPQEIINVVGKAVDSAADRLLRVSPSFEWEENFESFRGVPETFTGPQPGPLCDYDEPYDAFMDIWTNDIMELIARETNRYAKQTIDAMKAKRTLKPTSRLHQWKDTDADEIALLFAVIMYMGICGRTSQYEYWQGNNFLAMPRFMQIMTYNRFLLLNKFLHFVDNSDLSQNLSQNEEFVSPKVAKLQPVIDHLNITFSSLYSLMREISIDESLTLFKGRLSFIQAIRSKDARLGIKSCELCESTTGYLFKFFIYSGDNSSDATLGADFGAKTSQVVISLLKDLGRRGHCVTMNNFYNCPSLARYLKSQGFDCLGTLRTSRRHVPNDISKIPKDVAKGTIIARHSGDVSIIAWKDSKLVTMISTFHNNETYVGSTAGKPLLKPVIVRDYNHSMGGVDLKDQTLSKYSLERKRGVKWYIKMFKRLLNISIYNAFVLYVSSLKRRNKPALTHREFRYKLAKSLVEEHRPALPAISEQVPEPTRLRRDIVHEPKHIIGANSRVRCRVCLWQGKTQLVRTQCVTCEEFMCFETCWKEWHSLPKLKGNKPRWRQRSHND